MPFKFNAITGKLDYFEAGSASTFTSLTDTPSTYSGQGGKFVKVNTGETGLEFGDELWSKSGSEIYYNTGNVEIGNLINVPAASNALLHLGQTRTVKDADPESNDMIRAVYHYKGVSSSPYDYCGSALQARVFYGGGSSPVGTVHTINARLHTFTIGDDLDEFAPFFSCLDANHSTGMGRFWGTDQNVFGPVNTQAGLLLGQSICINNYNAGSILSGGWGSVITSLPNSGGGDSTADRWGRQTYPLDSGLSIVGWSGFADKSVDTNAFNTAIQVGGTAGGWMVGGQTSRFGTGISVKDWTSYGINIPSRKSGGTGPSISVASGAGRAEFLSGIKVGNFTETASAGAIKYDSTNSFQGYHNGAWGALGGGVNAFDGGAFTDTYVATVNFDGGAF